MRKTILALCAGVAVGVSGLAVAQDKAATDAAVDPARMAAARELMSVMGVTEQMEAAMSTMKQSFLQSAESTGGDNEAFKEGFEKGVKKLLAYRDEMLTDFAKLYATHFTEKEMKVVTKFYASGTGAKFVSLMPKLMQEGAAIGTKYSTKMMQELKLEARP